MKRNEVISDFGQFDQAALEKLQANLRLTLPLHKLLSIAAYYRTKLRRDPIAEELLILDRLARTATQNPDNFLIAALSTNDAQVAETYADMMQKRAALSPNAETPPSLSELFELAGNYLARAGKQVDLGASLLIEDAAASPSPLSCRSYVTASTTRTGLRTFANGKRKPAVGDLWVTLAPADGEDTVSYRAALSRVWSAPDLTCSFADVRALDARGLLPALLDMDEGFTIDLSKIDTEGFVFDRALMADAAGAYLIRVPADRYFRVSRALRKMGIRASAIAVIAREQIAHLIFPDGTRAGWELNFLKGLCPLISCEVKLPNEADGAFAPIGSKPLTLASARYLTADCSAAPDWMHLQSDLSAAVAVCQPTGRFFENALRTALSAVMTLTAAGCRYTRQVIAVGLTLPMQNGDPKRLGEALSCVLGLYRLQAELGLPMTAGKILFGNVEHPEISVFALTGEPAVKSFGFSCPDRPLYCLAPKTSETLDFEDLRRLLTMVADLRRDGDFSAARPMLNEKLGAALSALETDCVTATLDTAVAGYDDCPAIAFLLEAANEIEATAIGLTAAKEHTEDKKSVATQTLPEVTCLIPSLRPEVVLLDACENPDLRLLADLLEERGANVQVFTAADLVPITHLCRAILGAQTLIVSPDVELPNDPYLGFALRTLARANGRILFPARAVAPEIAGAVALPDGICDAILTQISKK